MVLTALVAPPRRMTELTAHKPQHINTTALALACREHPLPRWVRDDARLRTPQPTQNFADVRSRRPLGSRTRKFSPALIGLARRRDRVGPRRRHSGYLWLLSDVNPNSKGGVRPV